MRRSKRRTLWRACPLPVLLLMLAAWCVPAWAPAATATARDEPGKALSRAAPAARAGTAKPAPKRAAFGWQQLTALARERAAQPSRRLDADLPGWLADLPYAQWQQIRFDPQAALLAAGNSPYELRLFHVGSLYRTPVRINLLRDGAPQPLRYNPAQFFFGPGVNREELPADLGFAGFAVYRRGDKTAPQPVAEFLGASFLRAGAPDPGAGTRGRALSVDTGLPSGEEFPRFTVFWVQTPKPDAATLVVYALLESQRVTGAYQFTIGAPKPAGASVGRVGRTTTQVRAQVYVRDTLGALAIAPLSTLFYFGEDGVKPSGDYRPEVHDADGLAVHDADEGWLWRPLRNPARLTIERLSPGNVEGFGLLQRDREFSHYQDLGQALERRSSVWVTPGANWPPGEIEMVELPLDDAFNHNVLAQWVLETPPAPGESLEYSYAMDWGALDPAPETLGRAIATRYAAITHPRALIIAQVDFAGGALSKLGPNDMPKGQGVVLEGGKLRSHALLRDPATGMWRLTLRIAPDRNVPVQIDARLVRNGETLTETWHGAIPRERLP